MLNIEELKSLSSIQLIELKKDTENKIKSKKSNAASFYEKNITLTLSMETDLIKIGTSKKHSETFKRTTSRLHEMTISKYS